MTSARSWAAYFTPSPMLVGLGLHCLGVGGQQGRVPPVMGRRLDHYAAVLIENGTGWAEQDNAYSSVAAGQLLWITPGQRHSYGPRGAGWTETWMLFAGGAMETYEAVGMARRDPLPRSVTTAPGVGELFAGLRALAANPRPVADALLSAAAHQLVLTTALDRSAMTARGEATSILQALQQAAGAQVKVADVADRCGLSTAQFRRRVVDLTGQSPQQHLAHLRMSRAKQLLAHTDLGVAQVGSRTGYDDPSYFTRVFTKRAGMSPRAFRERYRRTSL